MTSSGRTGRHELRTAASAPPEGRVQRAATFDLAAIGVIAAAVWIVAVQLDLFERLRVLLAAGEKAELDEIVFAVAVAAVGLAVFAVRRWREARANGLAREEAEAGLRASEARLRLALRGSPVTVFGQDRDLRYTWIENPPDALPPDVFPGRTDEELFAGGEGERLAGIKRLVLATGEGVRQEVCLTVDGEPRWYDLTVEPERDEAGEVTGIIAATADVTGQRRDAVALRRYAERLAAINEIDQAVLSGEPARGVAEGAVARLRERFACRRASVAVFGHERREAEVLAVSGLEGDGVLAGRRISTELFGDLGALARGEVHVVNDIASVSPATEWVVTLRKDGVGSYINVPLIAGGELVGALNAGWSEPGAAAGADMDLIGAVATALALALQQTRTAAALAESEEKYRALFASTTDGVALHRLIRNESGAAVDFVIAEVNPAYERHVGLRPADVEGRRATEVFGFAPFLDTYARVEATGEPTSFETDFQPLGKSFAISAFPMGEARFATVFRDVTTARAAERDLQANEARLKQLFDESPTSLWEEDFSRIKQRLDALRAAGVEDVRTHLDVHREDLVQCVMAARVIDVNRRTLELYGASSKEELFGSLERTAGQGIWEFHRDSVAAIAEGRTEWRGEAVNRTLAGEELHVLVAWHVLPGHEQDYGRVLVSINDVTEQRRAEHALRVSEERYRRLFEEDLTGDFVAAPDGTFLACNRAFARILGFASVAEVMRVNAAALYRNPEARAELLALLRERRRLEYHELELVRADGAPVNVIENIIGIFGADGELEQIQGYMFDISDLRQLEVQLRQSQKMEAVGSLAGGVAHDFNNLLQAMMSQVQVMRAHLGDSAALVRELGALDDSIRRGAQLTNQLLLFSRRETGQREVTDLNGVVERATGMLRRLVRANIEIAVDVGDEALPVEIDVVQMEQVLANLTVNAADAMPDGGRLVLRTQRTSVGEARLTVSDSGTGIPAEIRDRIFDPFFTTKGVGRGTGLGLAVVHGIVSRHGGRIEVESDEGRGTTFVIAIPLTRKSQDEAGEAVADGPAPIEAGRGERILVVEDEAAAREGLRDILDMLGYEVTVTGSGEEAGTLPAEEPFDLLLTDLMLPGVSGPDLARGLVERWPDLEVILMSGYTEDEAVRHGISDGSVRYLQKPFDMPTLARMLREALDG